MIRRLLQLAITFVCAASTARAIVLFDPSNAQDNFGTPSNGAPWDYIVQVNDASGVYLRNGYILTANHVNVGGITSITIKGTSYAIDQSYAPQQVGGADLKLIRLEVDPGLAAMVLNTSTFDRGRASTIIGWGYTNGDPIPNGWNWGGTTAKRWATNTTLADTAVTTNDSGTSNLLITTFDSAGGADEGSLALGDSGGALFQKFSGQWRLSGLNAYVYTNGSSVYDKYPEDSSYYVRISSYATAINNATVYGVPEPCVATLLLLSSVPVLGLRRRVR